MSLRNRFLTKSHGSRTQPAEMRILAHRSGSVSYTHLDVYKRQEEEEDGGSGGDVLERCV